MSVANVTVDAWSGFMAEMTRPRVLYCGQSVWLNSVNTNHRVHAKHGDWITSDIKDGPGVQFVADLQFLTHDMERKGMAKFDGIFCPSVLEHIARPWMAVTEMAKALTYGGALYIETHQTFPLHYYPDDFFRFSTSALRVMCEDAGLHVASTGYGSRSSIIPPKEITVWNPQAESWLNVRVCAVKR